MSRLFKIILLCLAIVVVGCGDDVIAPADAKSYNFDYSMFDPADFLHITDIGQVGAYRDALRAETLGDAPYTVTVEHNIVDNRYGPQYGQIDRYTVTFENGVNSIAYLFSPGRERLFIYHQGHDGDFVLGAGQIAGFVGNGYSVLAFSMPLLGMNANPFPAANHIYFAQYERPLQYFVRPVTAVLDYIADSYASVYMTGLSGGGWTTVLAAATDSRITKSYPVAGSVPMYMRWVSPATDGGDYEQFLQPFYSQFSYLDLYVLGSANGRQLQISNYWDPCCFGGDESRRYMPYVRDVTGTFDAWIDYQTNHSISYMALTWILNDANGMYGY